MLNLEDTNPVISIEALPPTLTKLSIAVPTLDKLTEGLLPQTLTSLEVLLSYSYRDWIKFLPPELRTCIVHSNRSDYSAASLDWSALPRGLTRFATEMYAEDMLELRHILALPPGLTELYLESDSKDKIDHRFIRYLPRSLTRADLWSSLNDEEVVDLPPALTSLHAPSTALPLLPAAVTDLGIDDKAQYWPKNAHIPSTIVSLGLVDLPEVILPILPPMLQSLIFYNGIFTKRILCELPKTLTSISTADEQPFTSEEMFKYLPPNLTVMDVMSLFTISAPLKLSATSASWLPRTLTRITIGECSPAPEWYQGLPPSLTSLVIKCDKIYIASMAYLEQACPALKNLTIIWVNLDDESNDDPSYSFLLSLPKNLEEFTFSRHGRSFGITNDLLTRLPRFLRYLALPAMPQGRVTQKCLDYLPQSLQTFLIDYNIPTWFSLRPIRKL